MSKNERWIAAALLLAIVASAGFAVAYARDPMRLYEGVAIAVAAAALSAAAVGWVFFILPSSQVIEQIREYPSEPSQRRSETHEFDEGSHEVARPAFLARLLAVAAGVFVAALVIPIRSLGPGPGDVLFHTKWRRGQRLAREDGSLVRAADLNVDSAVTVFPEDAVGDAMSQTMLVRLPQDLAPATQGYVAYSKVCTHAGCPVALYRARTKQLMCPCHQSVFDVTGDGRVVSGPADHALPQLPIDVDAEGFLHAKGDYPVAVGPGFWQRG